MDRTKALEWRNAMASGWFRHGKGVYISDDGCHCAVGVLLHLMEGDNAAFWVATNAIDKANLDCLRIFSLNDMSTDYGDVIAYLDQHYKFTDAERAGHVTALH